MLEQKKGFPEEGEIVLCTVTKIYHHSVFVNLDEYNTSGMLHISEVSPGRIRNLRDFVVEGKKIVCKVLSINRERGHIDLSLRRVTEGQKREKANELKQKQRAERILETVAKVLSVNAVDLHKKVSEAVAKDYPEMAVCFEDVSVGECDLEKYLDKSLAKELTTVIKTRIKPPQVEITGTLTLTTYHPDGVHHIKEVLKPLEERGMHPTYIGSGHYRLSLSAPDYKSAEKALKAAVDSTIDEMKKHGGDGAFERTEK